MSHDNLSRSYIFVYAIFVYFLPLLTIIYSYFFILKAVSAHEKNMRDQAKKMNVASLRSAENQAQSAECKLAKVALMTISLWFMAWTPYLVINFTGIFTTSTITPLATIWGSLFAKANAVYNPIVYGICNYPALTPFWLCLTITSLSAHPKYRAALQKKYPALACASEPEMAADVQSVATADSEQVEKA